MRMCELLIDIPLEHTHNILHTQYMQCFVHVNYNTSNIGGDFGFGEFLKITKLPFILQVTVYFFSYITANLKWHQ